MAPQPVTQTLHNKSSIIQALDPDTLHRRTCFFAGKRTHKTLDTTNSSKCKSVVAFAHARTKDRHGSSTSHLLLRLDLEAAWTDAQVQSAVNKYIHSAACTHHTRQRTKESEENFREALQRANCNVDREIRRSIVIKYGSSLEHNEFAQLQPPTTLAQQPLQSDSSPHSRQGVQTVPTVAADLQTSGYNHVVVVRPPVFASCCQEDFYSGADISIHLSTFHAPLGSLTCCQLSFQTEASFRKHNTQVHGLDQLSMCMSVFPDLQSNRSSVNWFRSGQHSSGALPDPTPIATPSPSSYMSSSAGLSPFHNIAFDRDVRMSDRPPSSDIARGSIASALQHAVSSVDNTSFDVSPSDQDYSGALLGPTPATSPSPLPDSSSRPGPSPTDNIASHSTSPAVQAAVITVDHSSMNSSTLPSLPFGDDIALDHDSWMRTPELHPMSDADLNAWMPISDADLACFSTSSTAPAPHSAATLVDPSSIEEQVIPAE